MNRDRAIFYLRRRLNDLEDLRDICTRRAGGDLSIGQRQTIAERQQAIDDEIAVMDQIVKFIVEH